MGWRRIALWLTSSFLLLLVVALCWVWLGDLGVFKPQLERWVTEQTGREFAIDGRFEVDVGRETVIVAEGVRFANAEWAESQQMLDVGHLELRIDTFSLFGAPLTIELIEVNDAVIRLEDPAAGNPSWVFLPAAGGAEPAADDDDSVVELIVRHINTDDIRVIYESADRTGPLDLRVATLRQQHRADEFLELTLDGQLNERNFDIRAVVGTWDALLAETDVEYEIEAQLDTFDISSKGTIDDLVDPHRPSLTFAASGPDINDLLRLLKVEEGGSGDIDLSGSLMPSDDGPMILDIEGRLGQTNVDASGSVSDLQSLDQFDVTMRASSPDISRILALFGFEGAQESPFTIELNASRQGPALEIERAHLEVAGAVFDLKARLPGFPGADEGTARLEIKGSDFSRLRELLRLPGRADGPFSLDLELDSDDQGEEFLRIALASTLASIEATGHISNDTRYVGSELDFTLTSDSLARVGKAYGLPRLPDLPMTASGSFAVEDGAIRLRGPVTADIDGTRLQVEGLLALAPRLEGSRLSLGVDTPDLAGLVGMFAPSERVPPLPIDVSGQVWLRGDRFTFSDVRGNLGQSSVDADGTLKLTAGIAGSEFRIASSGPAFEELLAHIPDIDVYPGTYELSGALAFGSDAIQFRNVDLSRPRGEVRGNVTVGLSQPRPLIDFDVSSRGPSVHSLLASLGDFEIEDAPFSAIARGGLRDGKLALARFDVEVGEATVEAKGDLDLEQGGKSTKLEFALNIPNLARLGLLGQRRPLEQGLVMTATVRGTGDSVRIDDLVAKIGESDVRASLHLEKGDIPNLRIEVLSDSLRLAPFLEEDTSDYDAAPRFDDGRLIPDIELPFDALRKLNASVVLDIKALQRESLLLNDVTMRAELKDGAFYLHEAGFRASNGWLQAHAALEPADGVGKAKLAISARDLRLGLVARGAGPTTRTDIDVNIDATGMDLRTLAGNSTGVLFLEMRDFTAPNNTMLKHLYGDMLNEILDTINPFSKADTETRIDCVVFPIEINNGRLGVNPEALVLTDKIRIVSDASINLRTEKLEMTFRTTPRKGLTISAGEILNPFVMVVGTLAAPRLAVDAKGSLISGGAAVATGGLSVLARATWERLVRSKNPCDTASKQGIELLQDRFAEFPTEMPPPN